MSKYLKTQKKGQDFGGRRVIKDATLLNCVAKGGYFPIEAKDAVKYTAQSLTDAQKAQARTNIGAGSAADVTANATAIAAETTRAVAAEGALQTAVSNIDRNEMTVAWDGASEPVIADIPAGVTVTYDGTDYTGTLAADSTTAGKIYLVSDGNGEYDRYTATPSGSSYVWTGIGSTDIDLSDYATVAEVSQLDQEVNGIESYTGVESTDRITSRILKKDGTVESYNANTLLVYTFPVQPGDNLKISGRVGTVADTCLACFYDSTGTFISGSAINLTTGTSAPYLDVEAVAPANAKSVKVSGNSNVSYPYAPAVKKLVVSGGLASSVEILEDKMDIIYPDIVNVVDRTVQGTSDNKGIVSESSTRVSIVLDVATFSGGIFTVETDADKYIRNVAFFNTETGSGSNWLYPSGNATNKHSAAVSGTYNRVVILISKSNTSAALSLSDMTDVLVSGFLTKSLQTFKDFKDKTFSVMGDSIGTDDIEDAPAFTIQSSDVGSELSSYVTWFDYNNSRTDTASGTTKSIGGVDITQAMVGTEQTFTPVVGDVGKTLGTPRWSYNANKTRVPWWRILGNYLGMSLNSSASWSGDSYCSHENDDNLRKIGYGWHPLQIQRLAKRDAEGNRVAPDIIFLCRGANDATHTPYAKLTDFGNGIDTIPANDTVDGGYGFKEALAKTISAIQTTYPSAKIYVSTLTPLRRLSDDTFPMDNGTATMQAYNKAVKEVAEYMGVGVIDFAKCWTFYNCVSGGFVDSSDKTHPLQKGHYAMFRQALLDITR